MLKFLRALLSQLVCWDPIETQNVEDNRRLLFYLSEVNQSELGCEYEYFYATLSSRKSGISE